LAYALASQIRAVYPEIKLCADLFSGAGGLSLGFQWAGIKSVVANDWFKEAGATYRENHKDTNFILGDITQSTVQTEILEAIKSVGGVDIIVGGPPCQGFSNAGLRMIDDPRNSLYKNFVSIVEAANPKMFVMENVEGIISINNGKTFQEIKDTFRALGYVVEGRKLLAAEFGIPQKRKRVFILGSRIGPVESLFPESILSSEQFQSVRQAIGDIPEITLDSVDSPVDVKAPRSSFQLLMQGMSTASDFVDSIKFSDG
jgi:DNA (cytosine-5)-methyltransferase 1